MKRYCCYVVAPCGPGASSLRVCILLLHIPKALDAYRLHGHQAQGVCLHVLFSLHALANNTQPLSCGDAAGPQHARPALRHMDTVGARTYLHGTSTNLVT